VVNKIEMKKRTFIFSIIILVLIMAGCIKETYDMSRLSTWTKFSPTLAMAAATGNVSIRDIVKPNDTVVFDNDNFIHFVFKKDSVIDFRLNDYADFNNLAALSFKKGYPISPVPIFNIKDTASFEPGNDIEIERLSINTGSIAYKFISKSLASASLTVTLPTVLRGAVPVSQVIVIPANSTVTGSVSVSNTLVDLSTDTKKRFNRLPISCSLTATSGNFILNDSIYIDFNLPAPDFDYVKGYFGQKTEQIDPDTLMTDLEDVLSHISGQFHLSNPSIKLNYSNSFGIPIQISLNAKGERDMQTVPLGLAPFTIDYPTSTSIRDVTSSYTISKTNSSLPDLVSLPPSVVSFSGSGKMNPLGSVGGRNNYLFSDSRFIGALEVDVPLELWINNLQFSDTLDNFLYSENNSDSPFKPEDMELFRLDITSKNGFPLGASLKLMLFDSVKNMVVHTIDATDIIKPAPIDASGKANGITESKISIDFSKEFFKACATAEKMIFVFTLKTSGTGTENVKIYSDDSISFKVTVVIKPNLKFN
jgi:LysM repeat protein